MNQSPKKIRIFEEEVKTQHTTHWDWDYLTQAQLDEMVKSNQSNHRIRLFFRFSRKNTFRRRAAIIAAAGICVLGLAAVIIHAIG